MFKITLGETQDKRSLSSLLQKKGNGPRFSSLDALAIMDQDGETQRANSSIMQNKILQKNLNIQSKINPANKQSLVLKASNLKVKSGDRNTGSNLGADQRLIQNDAEAVYGLNTKPSRSINSIKNASVSIEGINSIPRNRQKDSSKSSDSYNTVKGSRSSVHSGAPNA